MIIVELIRLKTGVSQGTFGLLRIDKELFCCTLEPPDHDNATDLSSIPTGQYNCKPYSSPKYSDVYEVCNVPGRKAILFHKGNVAANTKGCIILGSHFDKLGGLRAVMNSGDTFKRFRELIGQSTFHLTITENY